MYTEYHHHWEDANYETDADGDQVPTDEAWYRVRDQKLDEIGQPSPPARSTRRGRDDG